MWIRSSKFFDELVAQFIRVKGKSAISPLHFSCCKLTDMYIFQVTEKSKMDMLGPTCKVIFSDCK